MTVTYMQSLAQTRLQALIDAIGAAGVLVLGTSALSGATGTLVTFALSNPAGTLSVRTLTFSGMPKSAAASAGGVVAKAEVRTGGGTVVVSGLTVGAVGSACDIIVDTTAIVSGRTVFLISAAVIHP